MITIIFETHSTTVDNQAKLAAGWYDVALSDLGEQQAKDLGKRRKDQHFDAVFCSDLQRSYRTAQIAFGDKFPIIQDRRLRESNSPEYPTLIRIFIRKHVDNTQGIEDHFVTLVQTRMLLNGRMG